MARASNRGIPLLIVWLVGVIGLPPRLKGEQTAEYRFNRWREHFEEQLLVHIDNMAAKLV